MKVIAFYLPQFHSFPENDKWWGKGFTEWTNVKTAKKYHEGQKQPRIPLEKNYYDLTDESVMVWQSEIARKYSVYGFCFYHYWFNCHTLMEKPLNIYRKLDSEKKIHYCLCWANEDWTRSWADKKDEILIRQKPCGKEEWRKHFEFFLPFFKDEMYIREDGKPFLVIYRPELINNLKGMLLYWDELAKENGFDGICYAYQQYAYYKSHGEEETLFSYNIEYQPSYALQMIKPQQEEKMTLANKMYKFAPFFVKNLYLRFKDKFLKNKVQLDYIQPCCDYDEIWNFIINTKPSSAKSIAGAFVDYDNSPRRKEKGFYFKGVTSEKFEFYLRKQIQHVRQEYNNDYLFLFAWNEWGESAYLEPDEMYNYELLDAVRKSQE